MALQLTFCLLPSMYFILFFNHFILTVLSAVLETFSNLFFVRWCNVSWCELCFWFYQMQGIAFLPKLYLWIFLAHLPLWCQPEVSLMPSMSSVLYWAFPEGRGSGSPGTVSSCIPFRDLKGHLVFSSDSCNRTHTILCPLALAVIHPGTRRVCCKPSVCIPPALLPTACMAASAGLWFRGGEEDDEFGMESVEDRTVSCSGRSIICLLSDSSPRPLGLS